MVTVACMELDILASSQCLIYTGQLCSMLDTNGHCGARYMLTSNGHCSLGTVANTERHISSSTVTNTG